MSLALRQRSRSFARVVAGLITCVALGAALPAVATGLDVRLDIAPRPTSVTRSSDQLATYASYGFTLKSLEHDRFSRFKFKGTVVVAGLPAGSTAAPSLFSADGATCSLDAGVLECSVPGELKDCDATLTFTVTLKTPVAGTGITVSGKTTFLEHYYKWENTNVATASTALTEPSPDSLSTFVPASATTATTLYSGTNTEGGVVGAIPIVDPKAVPPINDPFTTTVVVPAGSASTTASVAERELAASCSANPRCFESKLVIPGSFDFLTIILRRDRTTLMMSKPPKGHGHDSAPGKGHDKGKGHGHDDDDDDDGRFSGQSAIDQAIVKYFPDDDPANPDKFIIVPNCSVVPGGAPTPKHPCIQSRKAYPTKSTSKSPVPAGLDGDWEFVILAADNGRYTN
jgi:hypothetical protein